MKNAIITVLIASLSTTGLISPAGAQMATMDQALTVAQNWITLTIHQKGDWGGSPTAEVQEIQELKRGERVVGYFCHVKPQGHLVVSLRKELAPVKAHSATCNLDPESNRGMIDLIKGCMERVLKGIEEQIGPIESVRPEELEKILEIDYRPSWAQFEIDPFIFKSQLESGAMKMDYQEGDTLLSSSWHQCEPYNAECPTGDVACTDCDTFPDPDPPCFPTLVGCVATAGSQIMKYWCWPPYGVGDTSYTWNGDQSCRGTTGAQTLSATFSHTYDWPNMANRYVWDAGQNRWEDENGDPLTQAQLDAVAELCYEVGVAVWMDYGVCGSGASTFDMEQVYEEHYRYSTACDTVHRRNHGAVQWFDRLKAQFNVNRPVQYKIQGHSIVGDGWQETGSDPILREYHMNYGWDDAADTWYTLDALLLGDTLTEYMLENIYPAQALGNFLSGTYSLPSFPYRYFDRDATGHTARFDAGHRLHFLPGITVTAADSVRFEGTPSDNTLLFSRGDESRGLLIYDGTVKILTEGQIKFH